MPINILYLIDAFETNYPRDQNYIIRYMVERGHNITVVTSRDLRFERYDSLLFLRTRILRFPILGRFKGALIYFDPSMFKLPLQSFDVIHSFTFFTFSSVYALSFRGRVKLIRSEISHPDSLTFLKAGNKGTIYSWLTSIYRKYYDYYTVYNELEIKSLELLGFPKEKITIVKPMIDFDKFSRLSKSEYNDEISIGVIARFSPEKGLHRLISIIKNIKNSSPETLKKIRLLLAGRIDHQRYAFQVLTNLSKLLKEKFIYIGEVTPPYEFYKMIDVMIVPSITETGAIAVLEGMAAGKIVIASDIYPINLYIKHGYNGFLFRSCEDVVEILRQIVGMNIELKSIVAKAQRYAQKHDYKAVCQTLEKIYINSS
ncbi:MAG: glycosyltransferase family 4 protein [Nitrososphaerota archaeon]